MQNAFNNITTLLIITTFLILLLAGFILSILFIHRKKQFQYQEHLKEIESNYKKNLFKSQLEIQEQTFLNISREIHDNITLSLTLAKLNLHTLDWNDQKKSTEKIKNSISLLTASIAGLSDISKSMNSEIIIQHGLLKALEEEINQIRKTEIFRLGFNLLGDPVFLNSETELIIFRIIQEAFNNIIKHANATKTQLILKYHTDNLEITIHDNGKGFSTSAATAIRQAGLRNMETRVKALMGTMRIRSSPGRGTILSFLIPFNSYGKQ